MEFWRFVGPRSDLGPPMSGTYDPLLVGLSIVLMVLMAIVFVEAFLRWAELLRVRERVRDRHGQLVLREVEE